MRIKQCRKVIYVPFVATAVMIVLVMFSTNSLTTGRVSPYFPSTLINSTCELLLAQLRNNVSNERLVYALLNISRNTSSPEQRMIYIITPTYERPEQIPEMTRLAQTFMNVPEIHWIVAEDTSTVNRRLESYLNQTGIPYTYLLTPMPEKYRVKKGFKPKGVANRNGALAWIRSHATDGVFYFADDDNTYDIRLFEEIRRTRAVSMFPVGLLTSLGLSTPIVRNGRLDGWYDGWIGGRKYPVDMAGFAISVQYLLKRPSASMPYSPGYEEDGFLKSLKVSFDEIEFLADNCTKVYVWHTKTKKNGPPGRRILEPRYKGTNLDVIAKTLFKPTVPPQGSLSKPEPAHISVNVSTIVKSVSGSSIKDTETDTTMPDKTAVAS